MEWNVDGFTTIVEAIKSHLYRNRDKAIEFFGDGFLLQLIVSKEKRLLGLWENRLDIEDKMINPQEGFPYSELVALIHSYSEALRDYMSNENEVWEDNCRDEVLLWLAEWKEYFEPKERIGNLTSTSLFTCNSLYHIIKRKSEVIANYITNSSTVVTPNNTNPSVEVLPALRSRPDSQARKEEERIESLWTQQAYGFLEHFCSGDNASCPYANKKDCLYINGQNCSKLCTYGKVSFKLRNMKQENGEIANEKVFTNFVLMANSNGYPKLQYAGNSEKKFLWCAMRHESLIDAPLSTFMNYKNPILKKR